MFLPARISQYLPMQISTEYGDRHALTLEVTTTIGNYVREDVFIITTIPLIYFLRKYRIKCNRGLFITIHKYQSISFNQYATLSYFVYEWHFVYLESYKKTNDINSVNFKNLPVFDVAHLLSVTGHLIKTACLAFSEMFPKFPLIAASIFFLSQRKWLISLMFIRSRKKTKANQ